MGGRKMACYVEEGEMREEKGGGGKRKGRRDEE